MPTDESIPDGTFGNTPPPKPQYQPITPAQAAENRRILLEALRQTTPEGTNHDQA